MLKFSSTQYPTVFESDDRPHYLPGKLKKNKVSTFTSRIDHELTTIIFLILMIIFYLNGVPLGYAELIHCQFYFFRATYFWSTYF